MMKTFSDFKTLQEAREELKKAFKKNAALRATKKELEKKFNQDINDLNQETQSLVEEIEKWQM